MANKIVQAVYDLRDLITGKLKTIGDALLGHKQTSDTVSAAVDSNNQRMSDSYAKAADAVKASGTEAQNAGSLFGSLKDHLLEIVSVAGALELALKGIQFGSESLKSAEDIEASLSRVQALATGAAGKFTELDEAVESAARAVNVTSQDSAAGLAALVTQGLSADAAIKALVPTLQLAKIANEDVGTAAATVAEALKSFNVPAEDAATVVDQLTSASHGAAGGLGAMSQAATQLAPDAKSLRLSFSDIISTLGLLSAAGLDSEKAVRGLRTVFQELEDPTSKLRVELLGLGDGTSDFGKAIAALTSGTPQAQKALLGLNGPARSLVETLGQAGPDAIAKFNAGLVAQQGIAATTAAALDNNLKGAATRFENSIDAIGEKLAKPVLAPFTAELTKLSGELNDFADSPDFQNITQSVQKLATDGAKALDDFLHGIDWKTFAQDGGNAIKGLADDLGTLAKNAQTVASIIGKTGNVIGTAYHGAATVIDGVVVAGAKLADTVTTLAQKGDALSEGADKASKNFEGLHAAFESVGDEAAGQAGKNIDALKDNVGALADKSTQAATATRAQGDASATAAPQIEQHATATASAATATEAIIDPLRVVPNYLKGMGDAADDASPGIESLRTEVQKIGGGPLEVAQQQLNEASKALADLLTSADATPEGLADANAAFILASQNLDKLKNSATGSAAALETAFTTLKVTTQKTLQDAADAAKASFLIIDNGSANTAAGLADRTNAFIAYANAALKAADNLHDGSLDATEESLQLQADALGITLSFSGLEAQAKKTKTALDNVGKKGSGDSGNDGLDNVTKSANQTSDALQGTGESADSLNQQIQDIGTGGFPDLSQALANTRAQLLGVSDAAAKAFDSKLPADFEQAFDSTGAGFSKVIEAMNEASSDVNNTIADQRTQLQAEITDINNLGAAGSSGFGQFGNSAEAALPKIQNLVDLIQSGNYDAGLLGQQELQPLQAALEAAAQRAQQLVDQVKAANDALNQLAQDTQDALDQEEGNDTAIEDRRHQKELDDLQAAAKAANQLNSQVYLQAVQQENQLHALKLKNIAAQQAAQNGSSNSGSGSSASKPNGGIGSGGDSSDGTGNAGFGGTNVQAPVINFHGDIIGTDPKSLAKYLSAAIVSELKAVQSRTIGPLLGKAP